MLIKFNPNAITGDLQEIKEKVLLYTVNANNPSRYKVSPEQKRIYNGIKELAREKLNEAFYNAKLLI